MRYEREDWPSRAMQIINARTRGMPEYAAARAKVVAAAHAICKGKSVAEMRELGGFSGVLSAVISDLPNDYRAPTGSAMFHWDVACQLQSEVSALRAEVQTLCARSD